jgi:hypothetical protein
MTVGEAICIQDWHIEAENGDRQECKRGKTYTTTQPQFGKDTVTVFGGFWVQAPKEIFAGWVSLRDKANSAASTTTRTT